MASTNEIVKLNVGGSIFTTTLTTLGKYPDTSMLAVMFDPDSGRPPAIQDSNGAYFIDRDPKAFEVVLRYLRNGKLYKGYGLSNEELLDEAKFYGLTGLEAELTLPPEMGLPKVEQRKMVLLLCRFDGWVELISLLTMTNL